MSEHTPWEDDFSNWHNPYNKFVRGWFYGSIKNTNALKLKDGFTNEDGSKALDNAASILNTFIEHNTKMSNAAAAIEKCFDFTKGES